MKILLIGASGTVGRAVEQELSQGDMTLSARGAPAVMSMSISRPMKAWQHCLKMWGESMLSSPPPATFSLGRWRK
jgi:hypothetical protein